MSESIYPEQVPAFNRNEYNKRYRQRKQAQIAEVSKKWREENRERVEANTRAYNQQNREKVNEWQRNYRKLNGARINLNSRNRRYGLQDGEFIALLLSQDHLCPICGDHLKGDIRTVVDHCHATSLVRGILCTVCNRAIGMLGDTSINVLRAAEYLQNFEKRK